MSPHKNDAHVLPHSSRISVLNSMFEQAPQIGGTEIPPGTQLRGVGNVVTGFSGSAAQSGKDIVSQSTVFGTSHLLLFISRDFIQSHGLNIIYL